MLHFPPQTDKSDKTKTWWSPPSIKTLLFLKGGGETTEMSKYLHFSWGDQTSVLSFQSIEIAGQGRARSNLGGLESGLSWTELYLLCKFSNDLNLNLPLCVPVRPQLYICSINLLGIQNLFSFFLENSDILRVVQGTSEWVHLPQAIIWNLNKSGQISERTILHVLAFY